MQSPTIFTGVLVAALAGVFALEIARSQAQEPPAASTEKPSEEKSSGAKSEPEKLPEATPEDNAAADALLQKARSALASHASIQADMKQLVLVGQRKLAAEGSYAAEGLKLRLEYRVRVGLMQGKLIEVCDGRILHTERLVYPAEAKDAKDGTQTFMRRDVEKILGVANQSKNMSAAVLAAELGIGGLPAMLASIDRSMTGVRVTETEFNGEPCQVFHGRWDQTVLTNYDKAIGNYKTNLAPFFPDRVELTLSKASDLPVRVVYLKNQIDQSGKVAGETPIMSLEFRDYRFEPLPPETFRFQLPSGREEIDQTEEYLDLIKKSDDAFGGKSVAPPAAATP